MDALCPTLSGIKRNQTAERPAREVYLLARLGQGVVELSSRVAGDLFQIGPSPNSLETGVVRKGWFLFPGSPFGSMSCPGNFMDAAAGVAGSLTSGIDAPVPGLLARLRGGGPLQALP